MVRASEAGIKFGQLSPPYSPPVQPHWLQSPHLDLERHRVTPLVSERAISRLSLADSPDFKVNWLYQSLTSTSSKAEGVIDGTRHRTKLSTADLKVVAGTLIYGELLFPLIPMLGGAVHRRTNGLESSFSLQHLIATYQCDQEIFMGWSTPIHNAMHGTTWNSRKWIFGS